MEKKLDEEELINEIENQRNSLSTDRLDMSFGEIISMYERDEIIIDPDFQRLFRWDSEQQTRFVESILLGIPIPPIFVAENNQGKWELVDGLQRTSTILSFFGILRTLPEKNDWILLEGERIPSLEGFSIKNLPSRLKLNIKRATCRIEIIRWNSNYDLRFELFSRLNTGGTPLTPQEIRNCIYRGISAKFNDFLKKLANSASFKKLISLSPQQEEQLYNEELILRFFSLYKNSSNITVSIAQHMSNYMRDVVNNKQYDYASHERIFNDVIDVLKPHGPKIFRHSNGQFATALYDTIMIGVAENISRYNGVDSFERIKAKVFEVKKDGTLIKFTRQGGNNQQKRIKNRLREANRIFGS
jgi:uncharacterized protein with ParB-like and HNH nuclease domain